MTRDDAADHSSENDPDFCYECQRDLDDCECDLGGPDDRDHEREGCVLGAECLPHDPFHTSDECFDVEMAKAPEDTLTNLLSQRRALVADLRSCGSDRLTRATIEAQIKMIDGEIARHLDARAVVCGAVSK